MEQTMEVNVREIAWQALKQANTSFMPVRVSPIAAAQELQVPFDFTSTRWKNALMLAKVLLEKHNIEPTEERKALLANQLLAPACVLHSCRVQSPKDIASLTQLPYEEAVKCAQRLEKLIEENQLVNSELEESVCANFKNFTNSYRKKTGR